MPRVLMARFAEASPRSAQVHDVGSKRCSCDDGVKLSAAAEKIGLEGVVSKRRVHLRL
jgi:hypothetical protein